MKHLVLKEIPKAKGTEKHITSNINKRFKHGKIKKWTVLREKEISGDLMVVTRFGKQVCRVNSMFYNQYMMKSTF